MASTATLSSLRTAVVAAMGMTREMLPEHLVEVGILDCLQTILAFYYPAVYLANLVQDLGEEYFSKLALVLVIPVFYMFLTTYGMLDREVLLYFVKHAFYTSAETESEYSQNDGEAIEDQEHAEGSDSQRSRQDMQRPSFLPLHIRDTNIRTGLTTEQALKRQKHFLANQMPAANWPSCIKGACTSPDYILILSTAALAFVVKDYKHLPLLFLQLGLALQNSFKSVKQDQQLLKTIGLNREDIVSVRRDDHSSSIAARELVPGDVIRISQGKRVPADGRIVAIEGDGELTIDQSIFGERLTVMKEKGNVCFASTVVLHGEAILLVEATGVNTKIGREVSWMPGRTVSRFERRIGKKDHVLDFKLALSGVGLMCFSVCVISALYYRSSNTLDLFKLMIALVTALSRDGPLNTEVIRTVGRGRLAKQRCLAARNDCVDALAGVDVLLADKTGIFTKNSLEIKEPYCTPGHNVEDVALIANLSSRPDVDAMDPIDSTCHRWLRQFPAVKANLESHKITKHEDFDTLLKTMNSLVETPDGGILTALKGAPKAVLVLCSESTSEKVAEEYRNSARGFALQGYRSLGVARKRGDGPWELLGLIPLWDPVRDDARQALTTAGRLGVSLKMMTGDAAAIAESTIIEAGMTEAKVVSGNPIELEDVNAKGRLETADVYAEAYDETKSRILAILQKQGHRVAMTGDDFSDKINLERADCGIASEGATMVAQDSGDMVMLEAGIFRLVDTIRICRQVFQQEQDYLVFRVVRNLHTALLVLWVFAEQGEILPVGMLILWANIPDFIRIFWQLGDTSSYSLQPARWKISRILTDVLPLVVVVALGSFWAQPTNQPSFHETRLALLFYHVLAECWLLLVISGDGQAKLSSASTKQTAIMTLVQGLLATVCVYGCLGHAQRLNADTAGRIWLANLGAFNIAVLFRQFVLARGRVDTSHTEANEADEGE